MSKSKGKARKAPTKKAKKTASRTAAATGRTSQITIFLFRTGSVNRIQTSPQLAYAGPGHVEWTVVNLIDGSDVPVTITWPDGGPWGKEPLTVRSYQREPADGVKPGRYKYVVSALDAQEDPEVELREM